MQRKNGQGTETCFSCRHILFIVGNHMNSLSSGLKRFPLKTCFCYAQFSFQTGLILFKISLIGLIFPGSLRLTPTNIDCLS
jgi:hypothetical protein